MFSRFLEKTIVIMIMTLRVIMIMNLSDYMVAGKKNSSIHCCPYDRLNYYNMKIYEQAQSSPKIQSNHLFYILSFIKAGSD